MVYGVGCRVEDSCDAAVEEERIGVGDKEGGGGLVVQDIRPHRASLRLADIRRIANNDIYHLIIY